MIETPSDAPWSVPPVHDGLPPFRCEVLYVDDHAVVSVAGEVDLATAPAVQRDAFATLALPISRITVDLSGVTFLDSSALNLLVRVKRRAAERSIGFELTGLSERALQLLRITGLSQLLGVEETNPDSAPTG
ncbi:MAG TPA: STAS domain-containing protein [Acidimicrobiia bacterium]